MDYLGIDPGLSGALALLSGGTGRLIEVIDMPVFSVQGASKNHKHVSAYELSRILDLLCGGRKVIAVVELVNAMPGKARGPGGQQRSMGATSAFNFGEGFGIIKGVLAGQFIRVELVRPAEWKKAMRAPADKEASRNRASEMMPEEIKHWPLKKHNGRAEAAMMAKYGALKFT